MLDSHGDQFQVGVFGNNNNENESGVASPTIDDDFGADLNSALKNALNDDCRGFSSVKSDCKDLRYDIQSDISFVESMEREMAIEMMKDKVELRRGLRNHNPGNKSILVKRLTKAERRTALKHVKDRVKKIRQARKGIISPSLCKENNVKKKKTTSKKSQKSIPPRSGMKTRSANRKKNGGPLQTRNLQPTK